MSAHGQWEEGFAELRPGVRLTRRAYHAMYEQAPIDFRAELIGGVVHLPERRVTIAHGSAHAMLGALLFLYSSSTPGVEACRRTTVLLGADSEPEPDLLLRVLPKYGGQSSNEDEYISGPPELVAEIAHGSRAIDLYEKRRDYAKNGVKEYLVLCVAERQLRWFDLATDTELAADPDGVLRIHTFRGLWLNADAVINKDSARMVSTLQQGLATPEHAEFVQLLASRHKG